MAELGQKWIEYIFEDENDLLSRDIMSARAIEESIYKETGKEIVEFLQCVEEQYIVNVLRDMCLIVSNETRNENLVKNKQKQAILIHLLMLFPITNDLKPSEEQKEEIEETFSKLPEECRRLILTHYFQNRIGERVRDEAYSEKLHTLEKEVLNYRWVVDDTTKTLNEMLKRYGAKNEAGKEYRPDKKKAVEDALLEIRANNNNLSCDAVQKALSKMKEVVNKKVWDFKNPAQYYKEGDREQPLQRGKVGLNNLESGDKKWLELIIETVTAILKSEAKPDPKSASSHSMRMR